MQPDLAGFVAAVSSLETEAAAARLAVEYAARALDANVAVIVYGGQFLAAAGDAACVVAVADLERVRPDAVGCWLDVPGAGSCPAAAATLEHRPGAMLVVARPGPSGLSREETGLLRAVAQVAGRTMRMLCVLHDGRAAHEELARLSGEEAALRRMAALVARTAPPAAVFAAVAEEVGQLLDMADFTLLGRYDSDGVVELVGA